MPISNIVKLYGASTKNTDLRKPLVCLVAAQGCWFAGQFCGPQMRRSGRFLLPGVCAGVCIWLVCLRLRGANTASCVAATNLCPDSLLVEIAQSRSV